MQPVDILHDYPHGPQITEKMGVFCIAFAKKINGVSLKGPYEEN
jgi:hypothetical protein